MHAIILAAGLGSRLLPLTRDRPKCLLDIGDGSSILERQVATLDQVGGIDRIVVVLGYKAEMAEAELRSMETDVPLDVVYNPFFQQVNALMSLWLALQRRPSEFLVLNGDTLFTAAAIRNLLRAPRNQGICVQFSRLVERHETQRVRGVIPHRSTDDVVKIMVDRGLLTHIGKDIPEERATGESAGAMRFLGDGAAAAIRQIEEMARQPVNHSAYWYALVSRLIAEGLPVQVRACPRDQWTEIDDRGDLELVKATMYRWQAPRGARPDRCRRSA